MKRTVIGDPDPQLDDCSSSDGGRVAMSGRNVGGTYVEDAEDIAWGWLFRGGFRPTEIKDGKAVCGAKSTNLAGSVVADYSPHHEPFQYYPQTTNPHHLPPSSPDMIGRTDQANHQYDLADFFEVLGGDRLPAVSFVKAKKYQDGHATLLPNMERMGLVNASEVALPSLAQTILAEVGTDGTLIGRAEVAAWATV